MQITFYVHYTLMIIIKKFCSVLAQLTSCENVTEEMFNQTFDTLKQSGNCFVFVIHDKTNDVIVGSATLLLEQKFTHTCGKVGHIEDVVTDKSCRGKGFGKMLIDYLSKLGEEKGCYKVILDAAEKNVGFYEKCGYKRKEICMAKYFEE